MKALAYIFMLAISIFCLSACVDVSGRSGPNDCYGVTDCYYTQRAFAVCNRCKTDDCVKACHKFCSRRKKRMMVY